MKSIVRLPESIRQPSLPRRVRALPVQLWPTDCALCFAPVPVRSATCPQCGTQVHAPACATYEAAQFSLS